MSRNSTALAASPPSERAIERRLVAVLRGRSGAITRADAVALSGLSSDEVESGLRQLTAAYESHLAVTEEGELLYTFDPAMVRRDARSLGQRLERGLALLWRGFRFFYQAWTAIMLVAYVAAFVAMLIALMFTRNSDDDRDRGGGGGLFWMWWLMPDWAPAGTRRLHSGAPPRKRFYRAVFDYVFGPQPALDARDGDVRIVAYLREQGGRISATDLVALDGSSYERAESEAMRLLVRYEGEPEIAEDGTLIYSFPSLRKTAGETAPARRRHGWQAPEPVVSLTGNDPGSNTVITLFNGFNLLAALWIGPAFLARFHIVAPLLHLLVTLIPLLFSILFFAIPAGRWLRQRMGERQRLRQAARRALIGELIKRRGAALRPDEVSAAIADRIAAPAELVARELERLLRELDGEPGSDGEGRPTYAFPRVGEELEAVARARALAPLSEAAPGAVVFSSAEEPPRGPRLLPN